MLYLFFFTRDPRIKKRIKEIKNKCQTNEPLCKNMVRLSIGDRERVARVLSARSMLEGGRLIGRRHHHRHHHRHHASLNKSELKNILDSATRLRLPQTRQAEATGGGRGTSRGKSTSRRHIRSCNPLMYV